MISFTAKLVKMHSYLHFARLDHLPVKCISRCILKKIHYHIISFIFYLKKISFLYRRNLLHNKIDTGGPYIT